MTDEDLWSRLQADDFRLSTGATLASHLTASTALTASRAERVVDEYRRFLYLAASGDDVAVPSPLIDKVWHRHLQDTRAYQAMADRIGRFVHHSPGRAPQRADPAYAATLARYAAVFGAPAPAKVWPGPASMRREKWLLAAMAALALLAFVASSGAVKVAAVLGIATLMAVSVAQSAWSLTSGGGDGGGGCGGDGGDGGGCGGD
ncbi:MAG: hypothetical protein KDK12_19625 [Rhodobacteraceae bacterium]|nr:hypothetical protein [Paracoccaceae bacterium]